MEDNYILPAELALLLLVWYLPPTIISSVVHVMLFVKKDIIKSNKALSILSVLCMVISSPVLGYYALTLPSGLLPRWMGASENMLFLPMAYLVVGLVSMATIAGVITYAKKNA